MSSTVQDAETGRLVAMAVTAAVPGLRSQHGRRQDHLHHYLMQRCNDTLAEGGGCLSQASLDRASG
jgi:hypothetical protein